MLCIMVRRRLSAYMDGELNGKQAARVARHLEQCSACRKELEKLRDLSGSLAAMEQESFPPDFHEVLMAKVEREGMCADAPVKPVRPKKRLGRYAPALGGAMAAVLLFVLAFPALQGIRGMESAESSYSVNGVSADGAGDEWKTQPYAAGNDLPETAGDSVYDPYAPQNLPARPNSGVLSVGETTEKDAEITVEGCEAYAAVYLLTALNDAQRAAVEAQFGALEPDGETAFVLDAAKLQDSIRTLEKAFEKAAEGETSPQPALLQRVQVENGSELSAAVCLLVVR